MVARWVSENIAGPLLILAGMPGPDPYKPDSAKAYPRLFRVNRSPLTILIADLVQLFARWDVLNLEKISIRMSTSRIEFAVMAVMVRLVRLEYRI